MNRDQVILLINDDGIHSNGLRVLADALEDLGCLYVVAPAAEQSGASQSITLSRRIKVSRLAERRFAVDGTPGDCVLYALRKFLPGPPDWVISGINRGPNLGDDTLYSGTVGGAVVAALHNLKTMAVSLDGWEEPLNWNSAAQIAREMLQWRVEWGCCCGKVLNLNVPNLPRDKVKGVKLSTLARRIYSPRIEHDPTDSSMTWYARDKIEHDGVGGSDCSNVEAGYASLSVLAPCLFDERAHTALQLTLKEGGFG